jgi:16S rRNA (uracil1498-N3)-methyltransferase
MPQFFVRAASIRGRLCVIEGEDFHHLTRVRRVRPGDTVRLRAEDGIAFTAKVTGIGTRSLTLEIIDKKEEEILSLNLTLCAALLKGKKFDTVIQKAAETGVTRIIPVISERTIPDVEHKEHSKLERWNRIAREAAKQCMRSTMPRVEAIRAFNDMVADDVRGLKLLAHPGEESRLLKGLLKTAEREDSLALLVGPEGGFSAGEIERARGHGWVDVNFGLPQLRAETASIVLPAILMYEWGYSDEDNRQR